MQQYFLDHTIDDYLDLFIPPNFIDSLRDNLQCAYMISKTLYRNELQRSESSHSLFGTDVHADPWACNCVNQVQGIKWR